MNKPSQTSVEADTLAVVGADGKKHHLFATRAEEDAAVARSPLTVAQALIDLAQRVGAVLGRRKKTFVRTLHWVNICKFVEQQSQYHTARLAIDTQERDDLITYATEQRDAATAEGYDDTAQYIDHIIDDLKGK